MSMEATEYAFPFDAEECEEGYDREYIADDFARYFRAFITSGIIADGGNIAESLQVVANEDMSTTLKKGNLIIEGYRYELMEDMIFHHTAADGVLDRIDRISVTLDVAKREIHAIVREGEYSYSPISPQCRRTSEHLDYVVADVRVVAGNIKITQANITDTRLSTDLCGIAFPFWKLDTQAFFVQLNSFYNEFVAKSDQSYAQFQGWQNNKKAEIEEWKSVEETQIDNWQKKETDNFEVWADEFIRTWEGWINGKIGDWTEEIMEWFNNLREQLTDNAEVRLQEQIGNINDLQTTEKKNLVSAINNVLKTLGDRITNVTNTLQKSLQDSIATVVKKAGDTMTGTLHSSKTTNTYIAGNQGHAIINSTAQAGAYTMLDKLNSTNGYFTDGVYNGNRELHYTPRATVAAGTNNVAKTAVLLDEAGNTNFPGEVSAPTFKGMATSAQKLASGRHINGMFFDGSGDISNYGYITTWGNNPNGYGMIFEITCPSLKELTTGAEIIIYSDKLCLINRGLNYLKTENTIALVEQSVCPIKFMAGSLHKFRYYNDKWHAVWSPGTIFREENITATAEDAAISVSKKLNNNNEYLVIGRGSSLTGNDDYFKISLLIILYYGEASSNNYIWKEITLGSSGSTTRFSISRIADDSIITIKTPKGSASELRFYRLA